MADKFLNELLSDYKASDCYSPQSLWLEPIRWEQRLSTATEENDNPRELCFTARISHPKSIPLSVGGYLADYDCLIQIIQQNYKERGEQGAGLLRFYEQFEQNDAFISGHLSLDKGNFENLWERIQSGRPAKCTFRLRARGFDQDVCTGAIERWDMNKCPVLIVAEADATFTYEQT
jgi:hypothetical protein